MINPAATEPLIAYIPAITAATQELLAKYCQAVPTERRWLWLVPGGSYHKMTGFKASIRALGVEVTQSILRLPNFQLPEVHVLRNLSTLPEVLGVSGARVWLPDDNLGQLLARGPLSDADVRFLPAFLRWDAANVLVEDDVTADSTTADPFWVGLLDQLEVEARKSSDWWRQVGVAVVRDGTVILTGHNHHLPDEYAPYIDGDPRDEIKAGEHPEISTANHGENGLIAQAARLGIALDGADMAVTTFPCGMCAKLMVEAGIARVFFRHGHVSLGVDQLLRQRGVRIIRVANKKPQ